MNEEIRALRETANLWRSRVDTNDLSEAQRREFNHWMSDPLHARAYAEAELLWHALGRSEIRAASPASRRWLPARGLLATAALLLVGVMLWQWAQGPAEQGTGVVTLQTPVGEVSTFSLEDGSQLTLGARSELTVNLGEGHRRLELVFGEAFLEVSEDPDRPLTVRSGAAIVRVTGTAFNVKRMGDSLRVGVVEGSVDVMHPRELDAYAESSSVWAPQAAAPLEVAKLQGGEQVLVSRDLGLGEIEAVSESDIAAWRHGKLVFFRAPLADLAQEFNRYSTLTLSVAESARDLRLTATFDAADLAADAEAALSVLEEALPVSIDYLSDRSAVVILKSPEK
ncbi:MAG: FecR domain-containing protein [Pseudomonadota bacterium]